VIEFTTLISSHILGIFIITGDAAFKRATATDPT
jgi:hypothetical protein